MPRNDIHLEPGCPWYGLSEMRLPNIKWCEANLCSWVVNPANTWSNLPYLILGVALLIGLRKALDHRRERFWLGLGLIVVGASSFIHHAAYTFFFQIFDYVGMYWFLLFVFFANAVRMGKLDSKKMIRVWLWSVVGMTAVTVATDFLDIKIQALIFILAVILLIQEMMIHFSTKPIPMTFRAPNLKTIYWATFFIVVAAICSALDIKNIWCDPNNHWLQGHAAWHVFSSIALFLLSKHLLKVKSFLA